MQALGSYKRGLLLFLGLGTGLGAALVADRRRHSHGAGTAVIQERHVRGLPRRPGLAATGQEEMAEVCRFGTARMIRGGPPRRRGPRGREREETEEAAEGLPAGQQRLRVHSAASACGRTRRANDRPPGHSPVVRRDDRADRQGASPMTSGTVTTCRHRTSHPATSLEGPRSASSGRPRRTSPRAVRARSGTRRTADGGGRGRLSRLFEEPDHR